jgi:hypothetical protein
MKRRQREKSNRPSGQVSTIGTLEPRRLAKVRGGRDLGITVEEVPPPEDYMSAQHNEALVRL